MSGNIIGTIGPNYPKLMGTARHLAEIRANANVETLSTTNPQTHLTNKTASSFQQVFEFGNSTLTIESAPGQATFSINSRIPLN
jgi:hypothetical protein